MWPGAWVTAKLIFDSMMAACGVTPQAQNTGISPSRIVTASPKSGSESFELSIPRSSGDP
eukprot:CAMPEP_0184294956 /NCGR_PEP_ID=MMETSP1049-20130417/5992_1 /TAXON_ID=77928 /ORGANISM="Proteomonas sulcata, Strain CCMP704" /LENGTH=59 /DNA_ID=CAMNT_0026603381 /DNA_START=59 /DNA_END=241 /DNA_ORIENTATION=+